MSLLRSRYSNAAQTSVGLPVQIIPNATITLFDAGTTSAFGGTIWRNATGTTGADQYANPFTTDGNGRIEFYLDTPIPIKVRVSKVGPPAIGPLDFDFEPVMPDPRDIVTAGKGGIVYLMDYAGGLAIDGGVIDATFAITNAVAAAAATGAKIVVPPGTFIGTWLPTNGLHVEGAGPATILKRPNTTSKAIWDPRAAVGTKLSNCTLDGNWANNHAHSLSDLNGDGVPDALVPEAYSGGTDNSFEDVVGQNWNWVLFKCAGVRTVWTRCGGKGRTPSTYEPDAGGSATTNYDSWTVFQSSADDYCVDMTFTDCWAESTRVGGMVVGGGSSTTIVNAHVRNTHRGESNATGVQTVGTWTGIGNGGGQIAPLFTAAAPGHSSDQAPTGLTIIAPQIGFSDGAVVVGIELNSAVDAHIVAPQIGFQSGGSITLVSCTRVGIKGGTLRHSGTGELSVADSEGCSWDGVKFFDHYRAVLITGTSNDWSSAGCYFKTTIAGAIHVPTPAGTVYQNGPHVVVNTGAGVVDGGAVPTELQRQKANGPAMLIRHAAAGGAGATSDGVEIRAGSTAFDTPWSVYTYNRGNLLAALFGNGVLTLPSIGARLTGDLSNATLANRLLVQTITADSASSLGVLPNGTSRQSDVAAYAHPTPASAAVAAIVRATATEMQVRADSPSGSYQPMVFYANNAAAMRISAAKDVLLGGGLGAKALADTTGYLWVPYSLGKPTGAPSAPTGASGMTVIQCDLSGNRISMWTGAVWLQTAALT